MSPWIHKEGRRYALAGHIQLLGVTDPLLGLPVRPDHILHAQRDGVPDLPHPLHTHVKSGGTRQLPQYEHGRETGMHVMTDITHHQKSVKCMSI